MDRTYGRGNGKIKPPLFSTHYSNPKDVRIGFNLPRKLWVLLNRIRTEHGRCGAALYEWDVGSNPKCDYGTDNQTISHTVNEYPLRAYPGPNENLMQSNH